MISAEQAREALRMIIGNLPAEAFAQHRETNIATLRAFIEQAQQDTARLDSGLIMMGGCLVSGLDLREAIDAALAAQGAARGEAA